MYESTRITIVTLGNFILEKFFFFFNKHFNFLGKE